MATTIGQYIYKVLDTVSGSYLKNSDVFNNMQDGATETPTITNNFTKLSFQAPTGTKITIDDNKTIIVGRSGYYEVPEGITVQKFIMEAGMIYTPSSIGGTVLQDLSRATQNILDQIRKSQAGLTTSIIDNNDFEIAYQAYRDELEKEPTATISVPLENIIIDYVIENKDGAQVGGEN